MLKVTEIRASKLDRPMNCAGFLQFTNLPDEEESPEAKEGTAFGEYVANILTGKQNGTHATNGVPFDFDMKFYAQDIVTDIMQRKAGIVHCETETDWMTNVGVKMPGHLDISYINKDNELCIDDCKYGWRIVEPEENWQLLSYAIGEVIRLNKYFPRIRLRILQPRPQHEKGPYREVVLTYEQLLGYKEQIEQRMLQISQGFSELKTGDHCKYCPAAAGLCPAFNRSLFSAFDYVMSHFVQDEISEREIAHHLDLMKRASELLKIKQDSLTDLAMDRIKKGKILPGYIAEKSFGHRKWKPHASPKVLETLTGVKATEDKMITPAQYEKLPGVPKDLVKMYTEQYFIGNKLVKKDAGAEADKIFGKEKPK